MTITDVKEWDNDPNRNRELIDRINDKIKNLEIETIKELYSELGILGCLDPTLYDTPLYKDYRA